MRSTRGVTVAVCVLFCVLLACQAVASDKGTLGFLGVRYLGMGGTVVGMADDYNSLLNNPTGLTHVDEWKATMPFNPMHFTPNLNLVINTDVFGLIQQGIDIEMAEEGAERHDVIEQALEDYPYASFEAGSLVNYIQPNFGVGLIVSSIIGIQTEAAYGDSGYYESLDLHTRGYVDVGGVVSYAHLLPWHPELLGYNTDIHAGATVKAVWRGYLKRLDRFGYSEDEEEKSRFWTDEDFNAFAFDPGFGIDLAGRLELNDERSSSVSLVLYNLPSGLNFSYDDGTEMKVRMSAAIGFASKPFTTIEPISDLLVGFDIQQIGRGGSYHLGMESPIGGWRCRTGISDDGFAGGLGIRWRSI